MNAWKLSRGGLATVVGLELRQRVRSRRWIWALVAWFLAIGGVTGVIMWAADGLRRGVQQSTWDGSGPLAFGVITLFVLGMGLVIAPTFTATSINSDRAQNTLATLQATRLSAVEIALGKLVAAWCTALSFLVAALPFIVVSMVFGNISLWQVVVCFAVMFAEVAVVCAIGLGWSALFSRTAGSVAMTYVMVVALCWVTLILELTLLPLVVEEAPVRVWGVPPAVQRTYDSALDDYWEKNPNGSEADAPKGPTPDLCAWYDRTDTVIHLDRVWWLSVANPFVIVSDAAPLPPSAQDDLVSYTADSADPLAMIRVAVRYSSLPVSYEVDECSYLYSDLGYDVTWDSFGNVVVKTKDGKVLDAASPVKQHRLGVESPVWPWGLAVNLAIGGFFFWVAVRRLSVPYGRLPTGLRVA